MGRPGVVEPAEAQEVGEAGGPERVECHAQNRKVSLRFVSTRIVYKIYESLNLGGKDRSDLEAKLAECLESLPYEFES